MANTVKGEVVLELAGGRELILVGDFQSRVEAERVYGKPYIAIVNDAKDEYFGAFQALFYGMLRRHQPEMTLDDVGRLFDEDEGDMIDAIGRAMNAGAAKVEDGDDKNPPKPRRTTKPSGRSGAK